jgi:glycosyltransferase involved in cell wall biosynthesis
MGDSVSKKVTAIIKTFERPHCVDRLVESIRKYYPSLPIIVADDSSKPKKRDDVEYYALPVDSGLAKGRNFLVKKVKTPYVLLLDDDFCFIKETHLEKLLHILETTDIDIVGGRYLEPKGVRNSQGTFNLQDGILHYLTKSHGSVAGVKLYDIINNFFLARTKTLRKYKWDNKLKTGGEHFDFFFTHKGKIKVAMHPEIFIYHFYDRTIPTYNRFRKRDKKTFEPMFKEKYGIKEIKYERNIFRPHHTVKKHLSSETIKKFNLKMESR